MEIRSREVQGEDGSGQGESTGQGLLFEGRVGGMKREGKALQFLQQLELGRRGRRGGARRANHGDQKSRDRPAEKLTKHRCTSSEDDAEKKKM